MRQWLMGVRGIVAGIIMVCGGTVMGAGLTVSADFEGGSARNVVVDEAGRSVSLMPGGDPARGWPCWWFIRVDGAGAGEEIEGRVRGSDAVVGDAGSPLRKPLDGKWAMPERAAVSVDGGRTWRQTGAGERRGGEMVYRVKAGAAEGGVMVAWGPPYTPSGAGAFVREMERRRPGVARAEVLCQSREGRDVPMLRIKEGEEGRFGVWVQARQHAWESGSSWVAQGFAEWVLKEDDATAAWLRRHAEVFVVPVMDVDNAATGNGGKDARPHDHNRDWSDDPHYPEVAAAQERITGLVKQGRMDVFLDLHNPAPADATFFFLTPGDALPGTQVAARDRFLAIARGRFETLDPPFPLRDAPKVSGPQYDPVLWRRLSSNWAALNGNAKTVSLCLETAWNCPASTADGYRAVGASLAAAVREYLAERAAQR